MIHSLNADKPYGRFSRKQLVGDVLGNGAPDVQARACSIVVGIHDTARNQSKQDTRQRGADDADEMIGTAEETSGPHRQLRQASPPQV